MNGRRSCIATGVVIALVVYAAPVAADAQEPGWPSPIHDDQIFWKVFADHVEATISDDVAAVAWDVEGWIGTDFDRLWLKSEGGRAGEEGTDFDVQALYSRLVSPYWDLQVGVRYEQRFGGGLDDQRLHVVVGLEGLAPYWFELEPALFVSDDGDVSARVEASYDLLLTQRLIAQPDVEVNLAAQSVEEWGVGSGLEDVSLALRLRYEIRREVAPFVGVEWGQQFGETADLSRSRGESIRYLEALAGIRIWF